MCTLIFAWQAYQSAPLLVAANREEATSRPAEAPSVREERVRYLAPRDALAGGTWIGYAETGVFVAITNRRADLDGDRSRGLLVLEALTAGSAAAGVDRVKGALERNRYAGFNLVVVDEERATYLAWDGALEEASLDPGTHVVTNGGMPTTAEKAAAVATRIDAAGPDSPDAWFTVTTDLLVDHDLETCRHEDGYGTRSSSLLAVDSEGRVRYQFADGPPCRTAYRTVFDDHL